MKIKAYATGVELANAVYQRDVRLSLAAESAAFFRGELRILTESGWDDVTYTYMKKPGLGVVHLSMITACRAAGIDLNAPVPAPAALPAAKKLKIRLRGLFYHEIGHLKRSDMTGEAFDAVPRKYSWAMEYIRRFSNACEDPKMERLVAGIPSFHFTKNLFKTLVKDIFVPQAKNYQDEGDVTSFLQYILLWLRCGPKLLQGKNAMFDSLVPKGIYDKLRETYRENDAKERCRKQVAFAIWTIDELGLTSQDMPSHSMESQRPVIIIVDKSSGTPKEKVLQPENGPLPPISIVEADEGEEGDGDPQQPDADVIDMRKNKPDSEKGEEDGAGAGDETEGEENQIGSSGSESDGEGDVQTSPEGKDANPSGGAGSEDGHLPDTPSGDDFDWEIGEDDPLDVLTEGAMLGADDQDLATALEIDAQTGKNQQGYRAKESIEIVDPTIVEKALTGARKALGMLPAGLAEALSLLKAQSAPYERHWLPDGESIDIDDFLNVKASGSFSREVYRDEEEGLEITDLAVSLLVDVSGSMAGTPSNCAFLTSCLVATACEESDIPYEVSVFSTGGIVYLKEFEDKPEDARDWIPVTLSEACNAYTQTQTGFGLWGGTDCESALAILLGNLRKKDEKAHKLVFIVTDGETGNPSVTGQLVKAARDDGIVVVGIGIGTSEQDLKECFERCKSFSYSSIGQLPNYVAQEIQLAMESKNFQGY